MAFIAWQSLSISALLLFDHFKQFAQGSYWSRVLVYMLIPFGNNVLPNVIINYYKLTDKEKNKNSINEWFYSTAGIYIYLYNV